MEVNVDQSLNVSNGPEVIIHRKVFRSISPTDKFDKRHLVLVS